MYKKYSNKNYKSKIIIVYYGSIAYTLLAEMYGKNTLYA